jgi:hypothetical protein
MMGTPTPLAEIEQRLRQRVRQTIVVSAIATTIFVIMAIVLFTFLALPLSNWRTWYLYVSLTVGIVFAATLPLAAARAKRGTTEFLRRIQPRTMQARWERFIGARVVFDNGLAFQQFSGGRYAPTGFLFTVFMDSDGSVLKPNVDDVTKWAKSFRPLREKIGMVTRKKGPPESQAALETIRSRLGAKKGLSVLDGHPSTMDVPPGLPRWLAGAIFFDNKWYTKGDQLLSQIDEIMGFLKTMPTRDFAAR